MWGAKVDVFSLGQCYFQVAMDLVNFVSFVEGRVEGEEASKEKKYKPFFSSIQRTKEALFPAGWQPVCPSSNKDLFSKQRKANPLKWKDVTKVPKRAKLKFQQCCFPFRNIFELPM